MTKYITLLFLALLVSCAHFNRELPGQEDTIPGGGAGIGTKALVNKTLLGASIGMDGPGASSGSPFFPGQVTGTQRVCVSRDGTTIFACISAAVDPNFAYLTDRGWRISGSSAGTALYMDSGNVVLQAGDLQLNSGSRLTLAGNPVMTNTAPTISSGFGTSPSVTSSNGTATFTVNVGTGGVATSGVIGLPAATNGWVCNCSDLTTPGANITRQTATATTSCTVTNVAMATGVAAPWTASDILHCTATGR